MSKHRPYRVKVSHQESRKNELVIRTNYPNKRFELVIACFVLFILTIAMLFIIYEFITKPGDRATLIVIAMVFLSISVFCFSYFASNISLYDEIRINRQTKVIVRKSTYLLTRDKWFDTFTSSAPFTAVTAIFPTVLSERFFMDAAVQINFGKKQPVQFLYDLDEEKAQEVVTMLQSWLLKASAEPQPQSKKDKAENKDITDVIIKRLSQSMLGYGGIALLIIGASLFTEVINLTISQGLFLAIIGSLMIIFRFAPVNILMYSIIVPWIIFIYIQAQSRDSISAILLAIYFIEEIRIWLKYQQLKQRAPTDHRFKHWHSRLTKQIYPYAGLVFTGIALPSWLWAQSINLPLEMVQEGVMHTAVFGFALGVASWVSNYPNKFASIAASVIGGITITLWVISQLTIAT